MFWCGLGCPRGDVLGRLEELQLVLGEGVQLGAGVPVVGLDGAELHRVNLGVCAHQDVVVDTRVELVGVVGLHQLELELTVLVEEGQSDLTLLDSVPLVGGLVVVAVLPDGLVVHPFGPDVSGAILVDAVEPQLVVWHLLVGDADHSVVYGFVCAQDLWAIHLFSLCLG